MAVVEHAACNFLQFMAVEPVYKLMWERVSGSRWLGSWKCLSQWGSWTVMCRDSCVDLVARYINCLFVCLLNFVPHLLSSLLSSFLMLYFLLIYFLTCLLPDLSIYSFQNGPVPFPGRRSYEVTSPGFSFLGGLYYVVYFVMGAWLLLLCFFQFFSTKPRDWLGRTSPKWPIFVGWDVKP